MMSTLRAVAWLVVAVAASVQTGAAIAASLSVQPLRLDFRPDTRATAITVRNDGVAAVVVQTQVLAWSQPEGRDVLAETREFLVTPAVVEVAAGGFQVLRIGRRAAGRPGAVEETFRVLVKEVLPDQDAGFAGVRMAMELSLPLFVDSPQLGPAKLEWEAVREAQAIRMVARNVGARHVRVSSAELLDADGRPLGRWQGVTYLLAGASRAFRFRPDAATVAESSVALLLTTEAGTERVDAILAGMGQ
jgi:fimbrial chaperone protein